MKGGAFDWEAAHEASNDCYSRRLHPHLNLIADPETYRMGRKLGTHMSQTRISEGGPAKDDKTSRKRSA
jgi:hypothetical protein